jgi:hypothetical protein
MIILADAQKRQGDHTQAESLYRQALIMAQQDDLQYTACKALIGLAELLAKMDNEQLEITGRKPLRWQNAAKPAFARTCQCPH